MNKLKLIIRREFIAKVRNKSFIMMTFLSPIILVGMGFLIYFLTQKNDEKIKEIVYVDNSGMFSKEDFRDTKIILP
jgi:ABC-2 type transport system permease protein